MQVEVLHKQLVQLRLEEVLGERTLSTMTDPQVHYTVHTNKMYIRGNMGIVQ